MQVKFKNKSQIYVSSVPFEQRLYQNGEPAGWLLALTLKGDFNSAALDELLTAESIGEIMFISNAANGEDNEKTTVLAGYSKVTSCVIRYAEDGVTAEVQLTKGV